MDVFNIFFSIDIVLYDANKRIEIAKHALDKV